MVKSMEVVNVRIKRFLRQLQTGTAVKQHAQADQQFQPGQRSADAKMDAAAETGVGGALPDGVEPRRVGLGQWVAVGGSEQAADLVAAFEIMAEQGDILVHIAGEHVQRRVVAQDFLDQRLGDAADSGFE